MHVQGSPDTPEGPSGGASKRQRSVDHEAEVLRKKNEVGGCWVSSWQSALGSWLPARAALNPCTRSLSHSQELRHSNEEYRQEIGRLEQQLQDAQNEAAQAAQAKEEEVRVCTCG
jgi:hypothetical protein